MNKKILSLATIFILDTPVFGQREERSRFESYLEMRLNQIAIREWESGPLRAAEKLGCSRVVWQLRAETVEQAITIYARSYTPSDCLILLPHQGGTNFYLGWAGQFNLQIEQFFRPQDYMLKKISANEWPGVPVYYISDSPIEKIQ